MYIPHNTEEIRHANKSNHNLKRKNQVILLMVTDGEKWHYLAVKKLSALFRGITWKHLGDFYCLSCYHSYSTKDKLKNIKMCESWLLLFRNGKRRQQNIKIQPWRKVYESSIYYLSWFKSLLEKINTYHNNPKKSSTTKINKQAASGYSLFTNCSISFWLKKITKCFNKSILFIFRRFECHHTHYQGTAFRIKFQFLLILQYS